MKDDHTCHRYDHNLTDCRCMQDDAAELTRLRSSAASPDIEWRALTVEELAAGPPALRSAEVRPSSSEQYDKGWHAALNVVRTDLDFRARVLGSAADAPLVEAHNTGVNALMGAIETLFVGGNMTLHNIRNAAEGHRKYQPMLRSSTAPLEPPDPDQHPYDEYVKAEKVLRGIGLYVEAWEDGDNAYHALGHIETLLRQRRERATQQTSESWVMTGSAYRDHAANLGAPSTPGGGSEEPGSKTDGGGREADPSVPRRSAPNAGQTEPLCSCEPPRPGVYRCANCWMPIKNQPPHPERTADRPSQEPAPDECPAGWPALGSRVRLRTLNMNGALATVRGYDVFANALRLEVDGVPGDMFAGVKHVEACGCPKPGWRSDCPVHGSPRDAADSSGSADELAALRELARWARIQLSDAPSSFCIGLREALLAVEKLGGGA